MCPSARFYIFSRTFIFRPQGHTKVFRKPDSFKTLSNSVTFNDEESNMIGSAVGIIVAYVVGTILGAVMMYAARRRSEVEVIEYTIDMMIQNKFIKTKLNSNSEVVLVEYDSIEEEE